MLAQMLAQVLAQMLAQMLAQVLAHDHERGLAHIREVGDKADHTARLAFLGDALFRQPEKTHIQIVEVVFFDAPGGVEALFVGGDQVLLFAHGHAGAFREDQDRPAFCQGCPGLFDQPAQRLGAVAALDGDVPRLCHRPADDRYQDQFTFHHGGGAGEQP